MLVVCEPGTYQLGTGQGPLGNDPHCESSHCELLNQTTLAMLEVVRRCNPSLTSLDIRIRASLEQSDPAQSAFGGALPKRRLLAACCECGAWDGDTAAACVGHIPQRCCADSLCMR